MIEVIYEPWKTLVIHDYTEYTLDAFKNLSNILSQAIGGVIPLGWANGILISGTPIDAEWADNEKKEGRVHWENVSFALMPQFQNQLKTSMGSIPIIDFSNHVLFGALSRWITKEIVKSSVD